MKIKKEEMAKLWKELQKLSQETQPIRFSYFIAKNKGLLKDEIDILNDLSKVSQEFISILKEDYEFNGYKIKIDLMPEVINPELLELFMKVDLIEE